MGNRGLTTSKQVRPISRVLGPAAHLLRCGVEQEYRVVAPDGTIDSRHVFRIPDLSGRRLHPAEAGADRCGWGGSLSVDGRMAEVATPAIALDRGFAGLVVESTERGRTSLRQALPPALRVEGHSTHIHVSVAEDRVLGAARLFAPRFTAGLMLLMNGRQSAGLLVRPRPGRLELGGEFADGDGLRAAILMATGAALACSRRSAVIRRMPPRIDAAGFSAAQRFATRGNRRAYGVDLTGLGRGCPLRTVDGGSRTAQQHLEDCWLVARAHVRRIATEDDLRLVDDLVAGRLPLPTDIG